LVIEYLLASRQVEIYDLMLEIRQCHLSDLILMTRFFGAK